MSVIALVVNLQPQFVEFLIELLIHTFVTKGKPTLVVSVCLRLDIETIVTLKWLILDNLERVSQFTVLMLS